MSLKSWIDQAEARLGGGPHPERAKRDAETLLLDMIGRDRAYLMTHPEATLNAEGAVRYYALVERRLHGEPIQYILGECEFFGLPFTVNRDVLIPRPETEHLVEKTLEFVAPLRAPRIVDIGTGSGAIAIALAHQLPAAQIVATDRSAAALEVARKNAARNGVADRIRFVEGDLLDPLAGAEFDAVVSNPPYVAEADRDTLAVEVREHEPAAALFAGRNGLDVYKRLIPAAHAVLAEGGFLALEIGCGQAESIRALLSSAGFTHIEFTRDLQGIDRVASARR